MFGSFFLTGVFSAIFSFLPSIEDTVIIHEWYYCGPFSVGAREGIIGIDQDIELDSGYTPDTTTTYPSLFMPGGNIRWQRLLSESEEVRITYDAVAWDTIQDYYGIAGILCGCYAYGELLCAGKRRALIAAQGISSFRLNGQAYPADVYHDGFFQIPVTLDSGMNRILLKASGFTTHRFTFKVMPVRASLLIADDITKPDILRGEPLSVRLGVPLVNTTKTWLTNLRLRVTSQESGETIYEVAKIAPLGAIKIPLLINREAITTIVEDSVKFTLEASFGDFFIDRDIWLQVKNKTDAHVRTFLSGIDSSCQYYAVLPPENYQEESTYALIMTCHGAGVRAESQVRAYQQKNWSFVIAPTNRRRFGFDWQDWGSLDFLEVLADAKRHYTIDTTRIYLTGHSMGGHGVWHIGTSHPDLFAAIAPSAGWTTFPLYIPWFLQKSEITAHPDIVRFRNMVVREDNPLLFLENACNLPVYILQGGADDNVPPLQARLFGHYLSILDYHYLYREIPEMGHWWDLDSTPYVDCVDGGELMQFLRGQQREDHPRRVICTTNNIGQTNRFYWVEIEEPQRLYEESRIDASVTGPLTDKKQTKCIYTIEALNVARFTLHDIEKNISSNADKIETLEFYINGERLRGKYAGEKKISFVCKNSQFEIGDARSDGFRKKPDLYGPIKQAYYRPFVLVYGTIGDSSSTENYLEQARRQSYVWWYRANGFVEILPDTEVTEDISKNHNLIVFGNQRTNLIAQHVCERIPIKVDTCGIKIGNNLLRGEDLCVIHLYPNPLNPEKFILSYSATGKKAEGYMGFFMPLYSGAGLPDFLVYDATVLLYGWGGVIAAGFYDKNWCLDDRLYTIQE